MPQGYDNSFTQIEFKVRDLPELFVNLHHLAVKSGKIWNDHGIVVGKGPNHTFRDNRIQFAQQKVHHYNEEKRREWTTLANPGFTNHAWEGTPFDA